MSAPVPAPLLRFKAVEFPTSIPHGAGTRIYTASLNFYVLKAELAGICALAT
jgi:hypothetical protein